MAVSIYAKTKRIFTREEYGRFRSRTRKRNITPVLADAIILLHETNTKN